MSEIAAKRRCALVRPLIGCLWLLAIISTSPAAAQVASDRAAITARLQRWAVAFNQRKAAATCDLFAPNLVATVPDAPERGRAAVCKTIAAAMSAPDRRLSYAPDIREIIVSGDLAVVRLVWTLTERRGTARDTSYEYGLDVFRKAPNGTWSIIRFIAFSSPTR